jgi:hypothetical protein
MSQSRVSPGLPEVTIKRKSLAVVKCLKKIHVTSFLKATCFCFVLPCLPPKQAPYFLPWCQHPQKSVDLSIKIILFQLKFLFHLTIFFFISLFRDLLHQALSDGCNCRAVCRAIEKRYGEFWSVECRSNDLMSWNLGISRCSTCQIDIDWRNKSD